MEDCTWPVAVPCPDPLPHPLLRCLTGHCIKGVGIVIQRPTPVVVSARADRLGSSTWCCPFMALVRSP